MIRYKNELLFPLSIIIGIVLLLVGCANKEQNYRIEKIDSNNDGQADIIRYFDGNNKIKEYIDYLGGIYKSETLFWDAKGNLLKIVTEYNKTEPHTSYYRKGIIIQQNSKNLREQKLDTYKTYKNTAVKDWLRQYKGKAFAYSEDNKLLYTTLDSRGQGVINSLVFYDDYGRISKGFDDTNHVGRFDVFDIFYFGKLKERKKIDIPVNSSIEFLKNFAAN